MIANDIRGTIKAKELILGRGIVIEEGTTIEGMDGPADRVVIGDNVFLGSDSRFRVPTLTIGDYTTMHRRCLVYGYEPIEIGHNGWIGEGTILNSTSRMTIGDNCGIGAHSQLWTHIGYGDVLDGCRFDSSKPMDVRKDVWFVGQCVVAPITAHDRSMALAGSVVTRDMQENRVYGGNPAADITEKVGPQFGPTSMERKIAYMMERIDTFMGEHTDIDPSEIGLCVADRVLSDGRTMFDLQDRAYTKTGTAAEFAFMRFLLPRAKFTPKRRD